MINLVSDTVTKPTTEMLEAMFTAEVGDDVFGLDPTVNALEKKVALMFGMQNALFCPSGTMTNQIAIKCHTEALDEMICDKTSHVFLYETGGYAFNSGIAVQTIDGTFGKIKPSQIEEVIKPSYDWLPRSKLVVLENSTNKGGGNYYTLDEQKAIRALCLKNDLKLHLDGARLFNVLVESGDSPSEIGNTYDSISICVSKGLGAPVGSVLLGEENFIRRARKFRKVMGGGMRQAGYLAAACIYALDHHVDRLKIDNDNAKELGQFIENLPYVRGVKPIRTNIVIFEVIDKVEVSEFLKFLEASEIFASQFGPKSVRLVTHLGITAQMIQRVKEVMFEFEIE